MYVPYAQIRGTNEIIRYQFSTRLGQLWIHIIPSLADVKVLMMKHGMQRKASIKEIIRNKKKEYGIGARK